MEVTTTINLAELERLRTIERLVIERRQLLRSFAAKGATDAERRSAYERYIELTHQLAELIP